MAVGDAPLYVALFVGVVVAAAAVVAFLNMTGNGRRAGDVGRTAFPGGEPEQLPDLPAGDAPRAKAEEVPSAGPPAPEGQGPNDAVPNEPETASGLERTLPLTALSVELADPSESGRPEPRLCGIAGDFLGRHFRITDRPLVLGRDPAQCGLVFRMDAAEISRKHCSLAYHPEKGLFLLQDHGSSNGTFLHDGRRLEPYIVYELRPGERFSLSGGRHWFEVRV
jgi:hypothetical protein